MSWAEALVNVVALLVLGLIVYVSVREQNR